MLFRSDYMLLVVAENEVSYHDSEAHRVALRTADVVVTTDEGCELVKKHVYVRMSLIPSC